VRSIRSKPVKPLICVALSALMLSSSIGAVRGEHAAYVGGTEPSLKRGAEGFLDTSNENVLRFNYGSSEFSLPYKRIATLEFGQKVGHRLAATLIGTAFLGLPGLLIYASKKKKHFLTIGYYDDAGAGQAIVFELGKSAVSSVLPTLETRSGKRVETESVAAEGFDIGHADAPHVPGPPPPPYVVPMAKLTIESNPAGAEVLIDTKSFGATPVTASLIPGSKYIVLKKDGFENWIKELNAQPGPVAVNAEMKKIPESSFVIVVMPSKR